MDEIATALAEAATLFTFERIKHWKVFTKEHRKSYSIDYGKTIQIFRNRISKLGVVYTIKPSFDTIVWGALSYQDGNFCVHYYSLNLLDENSIPITSSPAVMGRVKVAIITKHCLARMMERSGYSIEKALYIACKAVDIEHQKISLRLAASNLFIDGYNETTIESPDGGAFIAAADRADLISTPGRDAKKITFLASQITLITYISQKQVKSFNKEEIKSNYYHEGFVEHDGVVSHEYFQMLKLPKDMREKYLAHLDEVQKMNRCTSFDDFHKQVDRFKLLENER